MGNTDICSVPHIPVPIMVELSHWSCSVPVVAMWGEGILHGAAFFTFAGSQEVQAEIYSAQVTQMQFMPSEKEKAQSGPLLVLYFEKK